MGAPAFQTRLTARWLALCGAVLVALGVGAVVLTERVLDASDRRAAQTRTASAQAALQRELAEGDPLDKASEEVIAATRSEGVRLEVREGTKHWGNAAGIGHGLSPGACATVTDPHGVPWLACASGDRSRTIVAAVPVAAHRATVRALAPAMATIVAFALVALWLAARLLQALEREQANSAHIAHELRNPLTAMTAELEALRPADPFSLDAIARMRADVARLADAVDAILVLSRGASTMRTGQAPVVNVADLARQLAPCDARVEAPDEALVEGDERLMSLAARNLLDNAHKYGAGARLVRVSRDGAAVRLAVIDAGPGLDLEARERMFDRYWRGTADGDGRGLGLALVRAVAERHGGRAEAKPGPDGRGLEVAITLGRAIGWNE